MQLNVHQNSEWCFVQKLVLRKLGANSMFLMGTYKDKSALKLSQFLKS